ncbi:MAG: hypothetical protein LBL07_19395 [Tannerella sp.]|nr:hypothetical protein [Tannerella sp.]
MDISSRKTNYRPGQPSPDPARPAGCKACTAGSLPVSLRQAFLHGRKPSRTATAGFPSRKETFPYCYGWLSFMEGNIPVLLRRAFLHGRKPSRTATAGFPSWKETSPQDFTR